MEHRTQITDMSRSAGLRLKFNLVLVPTVALGIAAIVWADYRHESSTLMEAHAVHVSRVGTGAMAGPVDPWTLPDAATQRSLRLHAVAGGALLVVVVIVVNLTLQGLVLRPIAAANILRSVHEYDAVFERRPGGVAGASGRTRDASVNQGAINMETIHDSNLEQSVRPCGGPQAGQRTGGLNPRMAAVS